MTTSPARRTGVRVQVHWDRLSRQGCRTDPATGRHSLLFFRPGTYPGGKRQKPGQTGSRFFSPRRKGRGAHERYAWPLVLVFRRARYLRRLRGIWHLSACKVQVFAANRKHDFPCGVQRRRGGYIRQEPGCSASLPMGNVTGPQSILSQCRRPPDPAHASAQEGDAARPEAFCVSRHAAFRTSYGPGSCCSCLKVQAAAGAQQGAERPAVQPACLHTGQRMLHPAAGR